MDGVPEDFRIIADQIGPEDPWVAAEVVIPALDDDELMVVVNGAVLSKRKLGGGGVFQSGEKTWGQYKAEAEEREAARAAAPPRNTGRAIRVCGVADERDADFVCVLPPDHAEHTTSINGVTWHKAVNSHGNGLGFATVVPGFVQPKLSDLGGLFEDYGDHVEPSGVPEKARYYVGYYCPRGNGHWELVANEDYSTECRGKGWDLYLDDAVPDGDILPPGAWE